MTVKRHWRLLERPRYAARLESLKVDAQVLRAQRYPREIPRGATFQMAHKFLGRQAINSGLDLIEATHAAQVVPVGRQRPGAGGSRFFLHDEGGFDPRPDAFDFFLLDAIAKSRQFLQGDV